MMLPHYLRVLALATVGSFLAACFVETSRDSRGNVTRGGTSGTPTPVVQPPPSSGSPPAPANTSPIVVEVDTDKTMNAQPGEGVGVFTEYSAGGHWHVWWTCDTKVNPQGPLTCDFLVRASVTTGAIKTVQIEAPEGAVTGAGNPVQLLEARTTTGSDLHGFSFDTDPGAVLTLEAAVGDVRDPKYFFFVQNGKVNGGFTGQLSNPLMLEGTVP